MFGGKGDDEPAQDLRIAGTNDDFVVALDAERGGCAPRAVSDFVRSDERDSAPIECGDEETFPN